MNVVVRGCTFQGVAGSGVFYQPSFGWELIPTTFAEITDCTFDQNGINGVRLSAEVWTTAINATVIRNNFTSK